MKIALYCAITGTVVGYGEFRSSPVVTSFRLELLFAMEIFVVGHEVGHCYFEERGRDKSLSAVDEEFACDRYALTISRAVADHRNNWAAFSGAGAYLFLRAAAICSLARKSDEITSIPTHPQSAERAAALVATIRANTAVDQVEATMAYIGDMEVLCDEITTLLEDVIKKRL
jgi:hypothetical protein